MAGGLSAGISAGWLGGDCMRRPKRGELSGMVRGRGERTGREDGDSDGVGSIVEVEWESER